MSKTKSFFPYSWYIDEKEMRNTHIRIYGIDNNKKNICVKVYDFQPYVYIELPEDIDWNTYKINLILKKIEQKFKAINNHELVYKKRLYYANLDKDKKIKTFPYLLCKFNNTKDIRNLTYVLKDKINISQIGIIKLKVHEQDASPILQLCCTQDIPTSGWIKYMGQIVEDEEKETSCHFEYVVKYKNLVPIKDRNFIPKPKIMGFDIEVNSSNPSAMPKAEKKRDKIFQISCIFSYEGDNEKNHKKYLLSLGKPDTETIGKDVNVYSYHNSEPQLLEGFTDLILEENPNIIVGYNILGFDIPYMIERAKGEYVISSFNRQGFHKYNHAVEKTIKWSSSAYKNQEFQYLDAEGRLFVDLMPLVKRDYKLDNYKLKTVSEYFLKDTKADLSPKGIFKCYRIGMKGGIKGAKALSICGNYCVQDSVLVVKLMEKLQIWVGLCEMASVYNVTPFSLYTQGQQVKVYSQIYKYCYINNYVVEKDGYTTSDNERYVGAHVFDPIPGCYDRVVPFDFCSLYPTTIIAYNIDYSTLVLDKDIPDKDCHIMEWEDHIGCSHDPKVIRKIQLTKYIDEQKEEITKLRTLRDKSKKNKKYKEEIIYKIDEITKKLKPYQEERTNLQKSKPKFPMCSKRYYRFLKEPKGVLPTILQNLLDARKNTRSQIKDINKQIKSSEDSDKNKELLLLNNVLDKRQLAYKISANSAYGALGVRKGYLPFMPGAMCLDGNSKISLAYGFSRKMKDLIDTKYLWSYENGQKVSYGNGLKYNGKKEVLKITLLDGRTLRCTPNHKIMTTSGWIEAGSLLPKHKWDGKLLQENDDFSKVLIGLELPEDMISSDEIEWNILDYNLNNLENREKALAFSRVLGYILSDGSISMYSNKFNKELYSCKVSIGTLIDAKIFVNDIKLITNFEPKITNSERIEIKGRTFGVSIPKILLDKILLLDGIIVGKRSTQPYTLPTFLFKENCPLSIIREFLGGLFGGDGISPSLSISHPSFSPIGMQLTTIEKYKNNMSMCMNSIIYLLKKCELDFWQNPPKLVRVREELKPKDIKVNSRWEYFITTNSSNSLLFAKKVGFRYSSDKNNKLSIASSYQRYSDSVRRQHIDKVLEGVKIYISETVERAHKKIFEKECPLHFPSAREYTKMTSCENWFSENKYSKKVYSLRTDEVSPCFYLDVVDVRYDGIEDVYDIIDVPEHSFFSNGIVVHNCTTYMGRKNIEIVAKTIQEEFKGELVYGD